MTLSIAHRWVLGGTLTMAAAMGIGRFAYTPLLPSMQEAFGWSLAEAGDVASANYLGYMIGALLAPRALTGPRPLTWLGVSLMASVVTTLAGAYVETFAGWSAVRLCSGIASAYCLVITTTLLGQVLLASRRSGLANLHFTGVGLGIVLTVMIIWPGGTVDYQWLKLTALGAVLMAAAWWSFRAGVPPTETTRRPHAAGAVALNMWRLVIGYGCFGYGYVVTATFIVAMARNLPVSQSEVSQNAEQVTWLLVGLAVMPSVYLWQRLAGRFGVLATLRLAYLVQAAGVFIAGWFSSTAALVLGGVLLGGTFAAITALGLSAARQFAGDDAGRAIGRMTAAFALGQLIGPAVSGRLADLFDGFTVPSLIAGGLLVLGSVLLVRFPAGSKIAA